MAVALVNEAASGDVGNASEFITANGWLAEVAESVHKHGTGRQTGIENDQVAVILAVASLLLIVCIAVLLVGWRVRAAGAAASQPAKSRHVHITN